MDGNALHPPNGANPENNQQISYAPVQDSGRNPRSLRPYTRNQTYGTQPAYVMNLAYMPVPGYALPSPNPNMPSFNTQYSAYAFGDPFYAYPRVPVTPSLLCAYAHMRGRVDEEYDPLHQSLFATPSRAFQSGKVILPLIFKRASIEELPRGATYFWDPILETRTREEVEGRAKNEGFAEEGVGFHTTLKYPKGDSGYESPPLTVLEREDNIYDDFRLPSPKMDSQTYKEYIETHPPRCIAPNHYKGDMVFANFGYVNIEGKWVDPESEGELYRAYMNPTEGPNSKIPLPTLRQRLDSGPRIMAPEEQLKFYNEYVMNVTDWVDAEGDPRMLRISPATFLRWAAGAVKGEHFEETPLAAQEFPAEGFLDGTEDEDNLFKIDHKVQFDLDSRSILSGMYTPDPNPRPHKNPHGHTNIIRAPATFAYSYPQAALDLEKAVFGSGSNDSTTAYSPVSMASTPETFTSEKAIVNLAQGNANDLAIAEAVYERNRSYILHLREQQQNVTIKEMEEFEKKARDAAAVRMDLNFEVFVMEAQIEALKEFKPIATPLTPPTPFTRTTTPTPQAVPEQDSAEAEEEELCEPPVHRLRRTKQYKRYLREEIERERIQYERVKQTDARLQNDLQAIIDDIKSLQKLKNDLCVAMQKATDDIRTQQENNYRIPRSPPGLGREI